ncbi:CocE/NonD family hydrolase [Streptomyces sp. NPDC102360]|uniref:CocE/NonD family hydrolase n=1 Tax=Streptomyces sp. NPDC102360 TaxID=3366160 RepID=UPI0038258DCB
MDREHEAGGPDVARDAEVAMRDGVVLRADVFRPEHDPSQVLPVLLLRTPYDKSVYGALGEMWAAAGYVAVLQDTRGLHASEGVWEPYVNEANDSEDTIAWAAALPGTTGEVGMIGTSYVAGCALQAAVRKPPALKALAIGMTPVDTYEKFFPGGQLAKAFTVTWLLRNVARSAAARLPDGDQLVRQMDRDYLDLLTDGYFHRPLRTFPPLHPDRREVAGYFYDWLDEHARPDEYWERTSLRGKLANIEVPVLNVGGFYDAFAGATVETSAELATARGADAPDHRLILGPWAHNLWGRGVGELDLGPDAEFAVQREALGWMDRWLKGGPIAETPPVRYFSMGDNTWRSAAAWPPPQCRAMGLHLAEGGRLTGRAEADAGFDEYVHDPFDPVPSVGGHSCCYPPQSPMGPYDQRPVESRADVLVYTGPELARPLEVAGPVTVELEVTSSVADTDFVATLADVRPDGRSINLAEGIIRTQGEPGVPRRVLITLQPTAVVFGTGHRVRVDVASSNHPTYQVNPGTGGGPGDDSAPVVARQRVHHGGGARSVLTVHVVD